MIQINTDNLPLGGLSPNEVYQLIHTSWEDKDCPLKFNKELKPSDIKHSSFFTNTTILLKTLIEMEKEPTATVKGNLNRKIVRILFDKFVLDQDYKKTTLKYNNLWDNTSGNYTGLPPGQTDTHSNPLFAVDGYWDIDDEWVEGDYHLKSIAGRWTGTGWVNDAITSLCIDAGDPTSVYSLETEPNGDRINQGVYGGTIYASKSPYGPEPYCGEHIPYDTNDDCKFNMIDLAVILPHWLECNLEPASACND